ncbi:MAG: hypothetical protein HGA85_06355 [Nanoarchaeota archaeon]|nr:hypothetical protein [Nanoarchaeota archaeon]
MVEELVNDIVVHLNKVMRKLDCGTFKEFPSEKLHSVDMIKDGVRTPWEERLSPTADPNNLQKVMHWYALKSIFNDNNALLHTNFNFYAMENHIRLVDSYFGKYGLSFYEKSSNMAIYPDTPFGIYLDGYLPVVVKEKREHGLLLKVIFQNSLIEQVQYEIKSQTMPMEVPFIMLSKEYIPTSHDHFDVYFALMAPNRFALSLS